MNSKKKGEIGLIAREAIDVEVALRKGSCTFTDAISLFTLSAMVQLVF